MVLCRLPRVSRKPERSVNVPSLQARSSLRSTHPLILLTKLVYLTVFLFLLAAGWVGLSYLKSDRVSRSSNGGQVEKTAAPPTISVTAIAVERTSVDVIPLPVPVRLVYSCKSDKLYYHTSAHLPSKCERSALSEQSALQRGLKPCSLCIPE